MKQLASVDIVIVLELHGCGNGGQKAEWLGSRSINQKVIGSNPGREK